MKLTVWPLKGSRTLLKQHSTAGHLCWYIARYRSRSRATIIRWAKSRNLYINFLQKILFSYNSESLSHQITILWYSKRFRGIWPHCCFCFSRRILKQKSATFWITLFSCFSCQKWFRTVTTGGVSKQSVGDVCSLLSIGLL